MATEKGTTFGRGWSGSPKHTETYGEGRGGKPAQRSVVEGPGKGKTGPNAKGDFDRPAMKVPSKGGPKRGRK